MRSLLVVFACLGMVVAILSAFDRGVQVSAWSAVVADASRSGALSDPALAKRLERLPPGVISSVILGTGALITVIAAVKLTMDDRREK